METDLYAGYKEGIDCRQTDTLAKEGVGCRQTDTLAKEGVGCRDRPVHGLRKVSLHRQTSRPTLAKEGVGCSDRPVHGLRKVSPAQTDQ